MKRLLEVIIMPMMIFVLVSCVEPLEMETVTVVDMVGDTVEVPLNPKHTAVIARAAADMMVGFGLSEYVDGMYYSVLDNPWVNLFHPASEDFYVYDYNESSELFLSRDVDLVFAPEKYIAEGLRASGVTAITVSLYGNPNYDSYLYYLADLIAKIWPESADVVESWKTDLDNALTTISDALADVEADRSIYYVRGDKDNGIGYTDQGQSLLETIYGRYLKMTYLGSTFPTNKPSAEEIMDKNPDVIVIGGIYQNKLINDIRTTEPYMFLDAVVGNKVFNIPIGFVMWEQNSMSLPLFVYDQANKLYPEVFDFDIHQLTKTNYMTYFGVELTDDHITYMLNGLAPDGSSMYA
jgi:iron complex transport system substrate-binding protein